MIKIVLVMLILFTSSLMADKKGKDSCYSVQIPYIESSKYDDDCLVMEIRKTQRVRCGCFKKKKELKKRYLELKKLYDKVSPVKTFSYRFAKKQVISKQLVKPIKVKADENTTQPIEPIKAKVDENTTQLIEPIKAKVDENTIQPIEPIKVKVDENTTQPTESQKDIAIYNTNLVEKNNHYFISLSTGMTWLNVYKIGDLVLDTEPTTSAFSYALNGGYYLNENIFMSVDYQYSSTDNIAFHALFSTINYQFKNIYVGVILGLNFMQWTNYPIDTLSQKDNGSSMINGIQTGFEYEIFKDIKLFVLYKYINMEYRTLIKTDTIKNMSNIEHLGEQDFTIGVKYGF